MPIPKKRRLPLFRKVRLVGLHPFIMHEQRRQRQYMLMESHMNESATQPYISKDKLFEKSTTRLTHFDTVGEWRGGKCPTNLPLLFAWVDLESSLKVHTSLKESLRWVDAVERLISKALSGIARVKYCPTEADVRVHTTTCAHDPVHLRIQCQSSHVRFIDPAAERTFSKHMCLSRTVDHHSPLTILSQLRSALL